MPAFEALPGMPYWINLTTSDLRKASRFYGSVCGWDIEEVAPGYRLARLQGLPVAGLVERPKDEQQPDTWLTYFLANEMEQQLKTVVELGGRVLAEPAEVHLGRMALAVDVSGAAFGLIEPAGEESFVAAGEPGTPVWHELTCVSNYDAAPNFYHELLGWTLAQEDQEGFRYSTALAEGAAFAGILDAQGHFPPYVPSFWQSYLGVLSLDQTIPTVEELGGEIIRQPWDSPFGRMAIIMDSTGATVTLCEVAEPVVEASEADPLHNIDLSAFEGFEGFEG